ncbi:hypothetical protein ACPA9J_12915 [Pseudomonas aeruginosa]
MLLTVAGTPISHSLSDVVPALELYSPPLAPAAAHAAYPDAQHPAPGQPFRQRRPQGTGNAGYSGYNLLFIVLGALYWLLIPIGSAVILLARPRLAAPAGKRPA